MPEGSKSQVEESEQSPTTPEKKEAKNGQETGEEQEVEKASAAEVETAVEEQGASEPVVEEAAEGTAGEPGEDKEATESEKTVLEEEKVEKVEEEGSAEEPAGEATEASAEEGKTEGAATEETGEEKPAPDAPEEEDAEKGGEEFARLLEESDSEGRGRDVKEGDKVSGVLVKVEDESSFVDYGGRSEGVIRTAELKNEEGELQFAIGEPLEAFVSSAQDEVVLTRKLSKEDSQADMLYQAYKSGIPIEGRVDAVNKWGLGITIQGDVRAFCPISQVDNKFVENAEDYRGQTMTVKIIEFRNQGRNIVVSRRALLEAEQNQEGDKVRATLTKGAEVEGTVTRLESFGAFVDLGSGVEGLVHVSELAHQRVEHPQEVLEVGAKVKVAVLRTKSLGKRRKERISLSIKALDKDPWEEIRDNYPSGTVVEGKVDALEDFGAFVEVATGVRGLIHVSELADRRIGHPREVLELGQEVKVVVLEVDSRRRRMRLSIKQVESMESAANLKDFHERQKKEKEDVQGGNAMMDALRRANLID